MRKLALLAAAAACLAVPAAAQNNRGRSQAAPAAQLSSEQRAAIQQSVTRGRALYAIDRAAAVTTRDMLVRLPDPGAAGVIGWVAQPQGNTVQVTYYAREGDGYVAVYRGQLLGGRVVSPQVFAAGSRPPLDAVAARMAAAREAVAAKNNAVCGGTAFNTVVLPPSAPTDPILVYQISPRAARERVPIGGHFLTSVSADGVAGESVALTGACANLDVPAAPAGQRPRPLTVSGRSADIPNEIHVFLSLWAERPLAVATTGSPPRIWGVTGQGIGELRQ
jgi:hypothetical protein